MAEIKQVERVIRLLQRLALRPEVTVDQLYDYFDCGVPKRTLQRDLVELSCAGIPLVTKPGHGRELVWYLDPDFLKFVPMTIGSKELMASYFLERLAGIAHGTTLEADVHSLLDKAKQLVRPDVFHVHQPSDSADEFFGATFVGHIDYTPHSATIDTLITAISERRRCQLVYKPAMSEASSTFDADPYLILYHKGALYCVAFGLSHNKFLFLPIQRIRSAHPTGKTFKRSRAFSLEKIRQGRFGIFGNEHLRPQVVVLRFSEDIADVIAERIWHSSQKIERHADGSLTLSMKSVISDELRSWIAGWMDYVQVIKPASLQLRSTPYGRSRVRKTKS